MKNLQKAVSLVPDEQIVSAIADALKTAEQASRLTEVAINKALIAGQYLREKREHLGDEKFGQFSKWLEKHCSIISRQTAYTWMALAEKVTSSVELPSLDMPLSLVLSSKVDELPESAQEAQQMMFDFTENKSIRGCLRDAVLDGEESRMKRAINGKTKGGSRGENRKDWALYFGENLQGALAHAKHWDSFNATQKHEAEKYARLFLGAIPTELLNFLDSAVAEESKARKKGKLPEPEALGFEVTKRKTKE